MICLSQSSGTLKELLIGKVRRGEEIIDDPEVCVGRTINGSHHASSISCFNVVHFA
jgi:hypothetical protein